MSKMMRLGLYGKSLFKKETPRYIKLLAGMGMVYTFLPLDVLPDFFGLLGIADDVAVMGILTTASMSLLNIYYDRHPELV